MVPPVCQVNRSGLVLAAERGLDGGVVGVGVGVADRVEAEADLLLGERAEVLEERRPGALVVEQLER